MLTTDGRQMPAYTISSPMSLWLRWSKNQNFKLKAILPFLILAPFLLIFFLYIINAIADTILKTNIIMLRLPTENGRYNSKTIHYMTVPE